MQLQFNRSTGITLALLALAVALGGVIYTLKSRTQSPIIMGCILDLSKEVSTIGHQVKKGLLLYINKLNRAGGIKGRQIQLVFMDDGYTGQTTRQQVEHFLHTYKSPLLLCPTGSPTLQSYKDLIEQKKIFVFFPITGAPVFRTPDLASIVHWRTSYYNEGNILTKYILRQYHPETCALFYQDDSFGQGAFAGARRALEDSHLRPPIGAPYATNSREFSIARARLTGEPIQALGFFATAAATQELIRHMGPTFFTDKHLFGLSDLSEASSKQFMAQHGLKLTIAQCVPNPSTSQLPIVQEYRELLTAQGTAEATDTFMLEAYIAANLTAYILKQVADPYNLDSIISFIKTITQVPFKGLMLNFNLQTHQLVHTMWIDTGAPDWLEYTTD